MEQKDHKIIILVLTGPSFVNRMLNSFPQIGIFLQFIPLPKGRMVSIR